MDPIVFADPIVDKEPKAGEPKVEGIVVGAVRLP